MPVQSIGIGAERKDAWNKVTGAAKYCGDTACAPMLHARLFTSTEAHAVIESLDISEALKVPGIHAVVTGGTHKLMTGSLLCDMPVLAYKKVRYYGEPVALSVADEEWQAAQSVQKIKAVYKPLTVVNSPSLSVSGGAPVIHEELGQYEKVVKEIYPESGTNIASRVKIRKGNMEKGWSESAVVVEADYSLPQASHAYMETRTAQAEILPDGTLEITTASQGPHAVRKLMAHFLKIPEGSVVVSVPYVGGGYGGKVDPHPEFMAYLASKAVGGRAVTLSLTREECFFSSGGKTGADTHVKMGADINGKIKALEITCLMDAGAYADTVPKMAQAAAASCAGIYSVENICCDALAVYTNHTYATSFRGFGHDISTFCIERTMEKLAKELRMDPLAVRRTNLLRKGDTTPTQEAVTPESAGNPLACMDKLQELIKWDEGVRIDAGNGRIRAKGVSFFFKTSSSPTDASSGAVVTFCPDGTVNLNCGAVECGPGEHTVLCQLLAEALKIDVRKVFVNTAVDTRMSPVHWKTVASMSTFMVGRAVIAAAEDAVRQMKSIAAVAMRCAESDVEHGEECIYLKSEPSRYLSFRDLAFGVRYPDGNAVGGQVIGRGSYTMTHLTRLDRETGKGRPGPYWTPGAQAVEIEYDLNDRTYRLLRAITVIDAGRVINPATATGQVVGAMNIGLGIATREYKHYGGNGILQNSSLRTYKVLHYAEDPEYTVHFLETPNPAAPYGLRGIAEHGVLGMAPALANALSLASGVEFDSLPITFETLWQKTVGAP
jgi:CO/xanthine dehydrogenase Mo-binding subunit